MTAEAADPTEATEESEKIVDEPSGSTPHAELEEPALPALEEAPVDDEPPVDIGTLDPLTFATLEECRERVFRRLSQRDRFGQSLEAMQTGGEEGRRRALGWWVLGEYARCAEELEAYGSDNTAAFTRAQALLALGRAAEAEGLLAKLCSSYPDEPRARAAWLEARLLVAADSEDPTALLAELQGEIESAPAGFAQTADGRYLLGRLAELEHDWEQALDLFEAGHRADPDHRPTLARYAYVSEHCGLDELAIELYEKLLMNPPVDRRVLLNLGVLYEDLGREAEAASCYDTVLSTYPADERARLFLGDAEAAMSMYYDEDLEKKEDRLNQILRIPITDFELSVRARNCLNKMQILTLGDLVQRTEQELLSYKNFGETSLTEIKEILHSKGLRLGMPREEAVASIEAQAQRTTSGERSDVLNKPILELNLSIRARRTVESLGCLTLGDVTTHGADELLGMPNFGQTSLQELRAKLAEFGLKLKGE